MLKSHAQPSQHSRSIEASTTHVEARPPATIAESAPSLAASAELQGKVNLSGRLAEQSRLAELCTHGARAATQASLATRLVPARPVVQAACNLNGKPQSQEQVMAWLQTLPAPASAGVPKLSTAQLETLARLCGEDGPSLDLDNYTSAGDFLERLNEVSREGLEHEGSEQEESEQEESGQEEKEHQDLEQSRPVVHVYAEDGSVQIPIPGEMLSPGTLKHWQMGKALSRTAAVVDSAAGFTLSHVTSKAAKQAIDKNLIKTDHGSEGEMGKGFYTVTGHRTDAAEGIQKKWGTQKPLDHVINLHVPRSVVTDALNGPDEIELVAYMLQYPAGYPPRLASSATSLMSTINMRGEILLFPDDKSAKVHISPTQVESWHDFASDKGKSATPTGHWLVIAPQRPTALDNIRQIVLRGSHGCLVANSAKRSLHQWYEPELQALARAAAAAAAKSAAAATAGGSGVQATKTGSAASQGRPGKAAFSRSAQAVKEAKVAQPTKPTAAAVAAKSHKSGGGAPAPANHTASTNIPSAGKAGKKGTKQSRGRNSN